MYDYEILHDNFLLARAFITKVPVEYTITKENLKKSLKIWIKKHPLLQSTIQRTNKLVIKSPKYFVFTEKSLDEYDNFELIEIDNRLKWTEFIENELRTPLDNINGPLWRMKILKITQNDQIDTNEYIFMFTSHHAIGDGRNCYEINLEFFN